MKVWDKHPTHNTLGSEIQDLGDTGQYLEKQEPRTAKKTPWLCTMHTKLHAACETALIQGTSELCVDGVLITKSPKGRNGKKPDDGAYGLMSKKIRDILWQNGARELTSVPKPRCYQSSTIKDGPCAHAEEQEETDTRYLVENTITGSDDNNMWAHNLDKIKYRAAVLKSGQEKGLGPNLLPALTPIQLNKVDYTCANT
ncbi:hypothetical protein B0H19DRAFT_1064731 [Mycena capillaripes]|nr:hypothetical protein B0H19DRAFT_1064731 [Mycena capillaripes]